jgi:autotransporter-associated beta strand protein
VDLVAGSTLEFDADAGGSHNLYDHTGYQNCSVSGEGRVLKSGAGTMYIETENTYAGGTVIREGLVYLYTHSGADSFPGGGRLPDTGTVTVYPGAELDIRNYSDTIGGLAGAGTADLHTGVSTNVLTVAEGVSPGTNSGHRATLTVAGAGDFVLGASGTSTFELGPAAAVNDQVVLSGAGADLTLAGDLQILNAGGLEFTTYTLFDLNGGTISGNFGDVLMPTGFRGAVSTDTGDVILTVLPPPGTIIMIR